MFYLLVYLVFLLWVWLIMAWQNHKNPADAANVPGCVSFGFLFITTSLLYIVLGLPIAVVLTAHDAGVPIPNYSYAEWLKQTFPLAFR